MLPVLDDNPDATEARCVVHALSTRRYLLGEHYGYGDYATIWEDAEEDEQHVVELEAASHRLDLVATQYPELAPSGYPPLELNVIATLAGDVAVMDDAWGRLAAEGALLRLADVLPSGRTCPLPTGRPCAFFKICATSSSTLTSRFLLAD